MSASGTSPIDEAVRTRAAEWYVRLAREDAAEADWLAFETWLGEAPAHQRAYAAIEQVWADLDDAPATAATNIASLPRRPTRRAVFWGGGALVASVAAATLVIMPGLQDSAGPSQVFETAPGQPRTIALPDGTRITLNGGSRITAQMNRRERRVTMADAEAVFDVAKDPDRPFLIDAGPRQIRVVGTEFNVLRAGEDVSVAVRRGVVEIRAPGRPDAPLARLEKGQALIHTAGRDVVRPVDPDAALAWTTGRLVFQGERLDAVARTLSRYPGLPIEVAPEAGALPVTATLNIGSQDEMLESLSAFLPVRVERQADKVRLSLRR